MKNTYVTLPEIQMDGKLYFDSRLDMVQSLIPTTRESNHAADLIELPDGTLLCCWFAGSREGNSDVSIIASRLEEHGWSVPVQVSDDPTRSEQNPAFFMDPHGFLRIIYTAQVPRGEDNLRKNLQSSSEIRTKVSYDEGKTWGATEVLFPTEGSFSRQTIQILSSGRWIFGNWLCFEDESRNGSNISVVQISDDEGKTWRRVDIPQSRGRVHANILELEPGHLVAFFRSRSSDNIYRSTSDDNGESWTVPVRTILRNNNSSISAIKLQSGAIAVVYNDVSFNKDPDRTVGAKQRCPVTVAISEDGGITWPWRRIVEHGEGFVGPWNDINNHRYEYPIMMQSKDGAIHIAYSWGTRKCMKYVRIDEAWIRGEVLCYGAENDKDLPCDR